MNVSTRLLLALCAGCLATGLARAETTLTVAADTPLVEVSPRRAGRSFLRLPAIEYQFDVRVECDDNWAAESVSVSVADTHRALGADQIGEDRQGDIRLLVPAKQIAPLVLEDFCVAADTAEDRGARVGHGESRKIPAALSVQASLLCRTETEQKMTYTTQPLDINLICAEAEDADSPE